jgi:multidrug efflux system membrane fusion protein
MHAGAALPVTAYDRGGANKIADGVLRTFDSQIDPPTGTIKARALFPNWEKALYPNQFVNVGLLVDTHKDVTVMPTAGIAVSKGVTPSRLLLDIGVHDDAVIAQQFL